MPTNRNTTHMKFGRWTTGLAGFTTFHGLTFEVVEQAVVHWTPAANSQTTKTNIEKSVRITGEFDAPLSKDEVAALITCLQAVHDDLL